MFVSTYTAKAESESIGIGRTIPLLRITSTGTGTGSGNTQLAANIAAEEAAKRASITAVDTVQNIIHQVWANLTTGFKKEYQIDDFEYFITFDTNYISYANTFAHGSTPVGSIFWNTNFSGYVYKVNIPPETPHFDSIGTNFGNITAFISKGLPDIEGYTGIKEYNFNITVDSTINADAAKLIGDKTYNFTYKITWVGSFTTTNTIIAETVVFGILNNDLTSGYNYDSSKTDITLNAPGLSLGNTGILDVKKRIVLNGQYDLNEIPHPVAGGGPAMVYRIGSSFARAFVSTEPEFSQLVAYGTPDIENRVEVTELGAEKK